MTCPDCGKRFTSDAERILHDIRFHAGLERLRAVHRACCAWACICRVREYERVARDGRE